MTRTIDLVILNGRLLTFDGDRASAEALAISQGRIVAVGDTSDVRTLAGSDTPVIDAAGGTVMPGFIDSHVHLFGGAAELDRLNLLEIQGFDGLRDAVRAYAETRPDDPLVMCASASYEILGPGRMTTRHDLDEILPDRPLFLLAADAHTGWANTIALERAGILHGADTPDDAEIIMGDDGKALGQLNEPGAFGPVNELSALGGRDFLGFVTGADPIPPAIAKERAIDKDVILRGLNHCAKSGITGLHNMDGNFYQLELLSELEAEGRLPVRTQIPMHLKNFDPLDRLIEADEMRRRFHSDKVWSGNVKMFMDGVLDSYTALMLEPYPDKPGCFGEAVFEAEHFNEACIRADAMGLQIAVHAIGDAAVRRTLDGYQAAQTANGKRDSRHRIEHIETIDPKDLPRISELGAVASLQPLHSPEGGLFEPHPDGAVLHSRQIPYAFAWKKLRDSGAKVCFSTDWPVVPVEPMRTVAGAVHGVDLSPPWEDNKQGLLETLASYTRDNAWLEFNEHQKGALKEGYMADVVVMDRDLQTTAGEDLAKAQPLVTICDGQVTYTS